MAERQPDNDAVRLVRTFDAPVGQIWSMWTEPEHFTVWYGPHGASIPVCELDVRVGGIRRVAMAMQTPGGPMTMWFQGEHLVVEPTFRLVYTETMCDEHGQPLHTAPMGMPGGHPTTQVTVELEDLDGRTRMTLVHAGIPAGSPGASGWNMALDKLASVISAHTAG